MGLRRRWQLCWEPSELTMRQIELCFGVWGLRWTWMSLPQRGQVLGVNRILGSSVKRMALLCDFFKSLCLIIS